MDAPANWQTGSSPVLRRLIPCLIFAVAAICLFSLEGCASPSRANIELRKKNAALQDEVHKLKQTDESNARTIARLQTPKNTLPTLPSDRLNQLFTAQGLKIGQLTGGADLDPERPGDEGIKIYAVPIDQTGDPIKAAGSFKVELFDLAQAQHPLLGQWTFDLKETRQAWYSVAFLYTYVLTCPWQRLPAHPDLLVRVTFTDALTQQILPPAQRKITVTPPPPKSKPTSRL